MHLKQRTRGAREGDKMQIFRMPMVSGLVSTNIVVLRNGLIVLEFFQTKKSIFERYATSVYRVSW